MILVDSNVWIYFLDETLPEHRRVAQLLPEVLDREDALVPTIVQMEVVHHLVRRLGPDAQDRVDTFLAVPGEVESFSPAIAAEAAQLLVRHQADGIGGRDAALLVTADRRSARLASADRPLIAVAAERGIPTLDVLA